MENLLTIALPVYKRTEYIRKALDSAVNQTVKCQILLIDNNSPHDEFKKIIDSYNNPLITYVRMETTVPQDENFNNCFRFAKTPWVTILHDDDMLHLQFVEMTRKILNKYNGSVGGFAVKARVGETEWDGIDKKIQLTDDIKLVKEQYFFFAQLTPFVGVVLNREHALSIGGFDSKFYPIADFDFWYRYSKSTRMLLVNQELAYYRVSPLQSTNQSIGDMIIKAYNYRLNLIKNSSYNNPLTYLTLEDSRINNINFFSKTYPNVEIPKDLPRIENLKRAEKLLKNKLIKKVVNAYKRSISLSSV